MCYDQTCLGYMLIAILVGFSGMIYLSLRYRKNFLEKNMHITADQVWQEVAKRESQKNLKKSDLLFGIKQDGSASVGILVIKDANNQVVGRIEFPIGKREYKMWVGNDQYRINFPLSFRSSANLKRDADDSVLASYNMLNIFGKHKFEIPGYGILVSERPALSWRIIFNYIIGDNLVGMKQEISPTREIGKLAILPSNIPLHVRIFILVL